MPQMKPMLWIMPLLMLMGLYLMASMNMNSYDLTNKKDKILSKSEMKMKW